MKVIEGRETERTLDRLPQLPPDVEVPDDISALRRQTTPRSTAGGFRWMRWLAAIILFAAVGGLSVMLIDSGEPAETPVIDYMARYGTDNPVILDENAVPSSVEIVGEPNFMKLYGTDNPVFLAEADIAQTVDYGEYFRLYGTENPVFVEERSFMELYGTDNPEFVVVEERTFMELYGTDNPEFLPQAEEPVNTGEFFRLYGTENPVFVGR